MFSADKNTIYKNMAQDQNLPLIFKVFSVNIKRQKAGSILPAGLCASKSDDTCSGAFNKY